MAVRGRLRPAANRGQASPSTGPLGSGALRHIGLNVLYIVPGQVGGSEIYARRLIGALARERPDVRFTAFAAREAAPTLAQEGWPTNVGVHELPVRAASKPLRAAAELTLLPAAAARAGVDLLHSLGTTSPPLTRGRSVVTVLDLIYRHYPDTFPTAARWGLNALVGPGARAADRVIAISHAVKDDVVAQLRVPGRIAWTSRTSGSGCAASPRPRPRPICARASGWATGG